MSEIILISSFLPESSISTIRKNSHGQLSNANSNFQLSLLDGLEKSLSPADSLSVINIPNIGSFPLKYRLPFYLGGKTKKNNTEINDCSFLNLILIKRKIKKRIIKKQLRKILKKRTNKPIVIIYDIDTCFIEAVNSLKEEGFEFTFILIIPDLPGMTGEVDQWTYKKFKGIGAQKADLRLIDGFVLLSKYMRLPLHIENRPYMVMEGIYSTRSKSNTIALNEYLPNVRKYILYTGALDKRNGILNLIEAFMQLKEREISLVLCGEGDLKENITALSKENEKIIYLGQISHDAALELQREASILVNPRLATENFSTYSFPSKTMEYLASGTPLIMYKLDSLPDEYLPYLFIPKDNTPEELSLTISTILDMNPQTLEKVGEEAKKFILENKISEKQAQRLLRFASSVQTK